MTKRKNEVPKENINATKPKYKKFRPHELKILEEEFQTNSTLRRARRSELAKLFNVKESRLVMWFKNRRKKERVEGLQKTAKTSVPAPKPTQFYSSASNEYSPPSMPNTELPFCSSTNAPLNIPTSVTQFTQCSFANDYLSNMKPTPDEAQAYNQIESINSENVSSWEEMVYPTVKLAYSQPLPINSIDYPYHLANTNTSAAGTLQFSTDFPWISPQSVENITYTPKSLEQQSKSSDLRSVFAECLSALELVARQDTNRCHAYNYNNCAGQIDTVQSSSAIKWNSSDYVADAEINNPLDLINMFHSY